MFMLPMRSIVLSKSKPWNRPWWKCFRSFASRRLSGCFSRRYSPRACDLAEHVLVQVALRVAVLQRHVVEQVHDLRQQRRRRNREPRVLHVMRVRRIVSAERPQEREHVLVDDGKHLPRFEILEPRPPELFVRPPLRILPLRKDPPLDRLHEPRGLVLLQRLEVIEPAKKQQVGDLLDDLKGIGDTAGPECVPDTVDLVADFAGEHAGSVAAS
jgi:hypothetical protein